MAALGYLVTMPEQQPIEMILLRQLASYLTIPIWMMDFEGNLIYYNEPAETLLGMQFDDAGPVRAEEVSHIFRVTDLDGEPLPESELPILVALQNRVPAHNSVRYCGMDGVWRDVEISAMPMTGQAERFLGVYATFWEIVG